MNQKSTVRLRSGRPKNPLTKEKIVVIAAKIFGEQGFHGTSLDQIANAAGIRRASLLHHFISKKALYNAVLQDVTEDLKEFITDAGDSGGDFMAALDDLGSRIVAYLGRRPGVARLLVRELVDDGPYFKGHGSDTVQQILAVTTSFLKAGMDSGEFRVQDPGQLALSIVGVHLYFFATVPSTARFLGKGTYSSEGVKKRREAVLSHVRMLCTSGA